MFDEPVRPAWIQRCTYVEHRGGLPWQCRRTDPHPDLGHDFPPDAELGRVLHEQTPEWLAAQLRDRIVRLRHAQDRVNRLQAIAVNIAAAAGSGSAPSAEACEFLRATAPSTAKALGWAE